MPENKIITVSYFSVFASETVEKDHAFLTILNCLLGVRGDFECMFVDIYLFDFQILLLDILADIPADFLDAPTELTTTQKTVETPSRKYHKVDLNRAETVQDEKTLKFRTTTLDPSSSTDAVTISTDQSVTDSSSTTITSSVGPEVETTTGAVSPDDSTTESVTSTTETVKTSTAKSAVPAPANEHYPLTWILGGYFHSNRFFFIFIFSTKIAL